MKINIKDLIILQKKLDNQIYLKHNIDSKKIIHKKKLALIVELCEMINVNKCFKFWSLNKNIDRLKLGDEFIDCLHFILSLSIDFKMENYEFEINEFIMDDNQLTHHILELIENVNYIDDSIKCQKFIIKLLELSSTFGFSKEDIFIFYNNKNKENILRQKKDY